MNQGTRGIPIRDGLSRENVKWSRSTPDVANKGTNHSMGSLELLLHVVTPAGNVLVEDLTKQVLLGLVHLEVTWLGLRN